MKTSTRQLTKIAMVAFVAAGVILMAGLIGAPQAEAQGATTTNPCPRFSIQNVFDDPYSDWDRDRVPNGVELNNGLKPCQADGDQFCLDNPSLCIKYTVTFSCNSSATWSWNAVNAEPNGDWDRDGVTNNVEARNGANPCSHPCPYPTQVDLLLNPNGDWDRDGVSNTVEVSLGQDPCTATIYQPCPNWTNAAVAAQPNADWDRDGVSNRDELYYGTNPCQAPTVVIAPPVVPTYRYYPVVVVPPYRGVPYVEQPPAGYYCPAKNRYYNPATRSCGTRPVVTRYF